MMADTTSYKGITFCKPTADSQPRPRFSDAVSCTTRNVHFPPKLSGVQHQIFAPMTASLPPSLISWSSHLMLLPSLSLGMRKRATKPVQFRTLDDPLDGGPILIPYLKLVSQSIPLSAFKARDLITSSGVLSRLQTRRTRQPRH